MLIYKVLTGPQWAALERAGETAGAPVDLADGFVHFSTATQLGETLEKHFAGQSGLMLLSVEAEALGPALRWEPSRGGAVFPHLYRALRLSDVIATAPLELGSDGRHLLPEGLACG